ncbi:hypothetical protein BOTBODRAFT_647737 [Botryobasidium botryosum FD-172 SS1]|uniref:DNA replication complex GINS protein SLD5 n=1 Tax=Botryobasidium botryosum (strain FD-172 SS1) TaxID=930990 RepID=A0A067M7G6_BOTB1|nr:hypothetical protein BOTBODRAFT_647737 [Botryobasidium botryosum FD-172 SS1]
MDYSDDFDAVRATSSTAWEDETEDIGQTSLQRLTRWWINERGAPDILVWQAQLVEELLDSLHNQATMVQHIRSDPRTSEQEHFRVVLVQTEMERVKFLIRSYLRVRIHKIEKYAGYIMREPGVQVKLSSGELTHAQKYYDLISKYFHSSALEGLPENMRSLDEQLPNGRSMITEPDKDRGVFVRARKKCENVRLPNGDSLTIEKGSIHLLRYRTVEDLVARAEVELI